jgi:hypothetical protein
MILHKKNIESRKLRLFSSKELALISIFSSLWIVSQIYLGPIIGQIIQVHGVIQRTIGWFLMITLGGLTGRFGRVTTMSTVTALVTRIVRPGATYSFFVGFGYILGGLTFDLLFFLPFKNRIEGKTRKIFFILISGISGTIALIPYLFYKFTVLGFFPFLIWIPFYSVSMVRSIALGIIGTSIGISIFPRVEIWSFKKQEKK